MYLENLRLKNFKGFSNQGLALSKITVLLGANSAGKSSLLYAILAALQSETFPLGLSFNGPLVDLGDFTSVVFRHKKNLSIALGLDFGGHELGPCSFAGSFTRSASTDMPTVRSAQISDPNLQLNISRTKRYKGSWNYKSEKDPVRTNLLESGGAKEVFQSIDQLIKDAAKASGRTRDVSSLVESITSPTAKGHFSFNRLDEFLQVKGLAQPKLIVFYTHVVTLLQALAAFRMAFNYVGSIRLEPQRSYYYASQEILRVGRYGQGYVEQIARWQDDHSKELLKLKNTMRSLGLVSSLQASRLKNGNFEIKVRPRQGSMFVSLVDVGLGIAELLPILVADLQLPRRGTLAVSQPESHLHPSAQADLASYFVRRMKSASNRYIIETHSEYFINRLRLLVAQGRLKTDDLSIIYLSNDGKESSPHRVLFHSNGQVEGAPKEFFKTYMMDVMKLALTATAQ
jgi:hypothetical protein